jgi:hypothetical protein
MPPNHIWSIKFSLKCKLTLLITNKFHQKQGICLILTSIWRRVQENSYISTKLTRNKSKAKQQSLSVAHQYLCHYKRV